MTTASASALGSAGLCTAFIDALPICGASISIVADSGQNSTVSASDALAARLESMQFELGEGPHWDVLRTSRPSLHNDLAAQSTQHVWPVFGPSALAAGARGLFSFPLVLGVITVGVVDLYSTSVTDAWGETLIAECGRLALSVAARAVRLATNSAAAEGRKSPRFAAEMRREVHQATGMVLVQLDTSAEAAMSRLRAYAFANDRGLDLVAADVVAGRIVFSDHDDRNTP